MQKNNNYFYWKINMLKLFLVIGLLILIFGTSFTYAEDNSVEYLVENIENYMTVNIGAYGIFLDNKIIGYVKTKEEADRILLKLKTIYLSEENDILDIQFKGHVFVSKDAIKLINNNAVYTEEELFDYIIRGTNERRIHVVQPGENFWVISIQYKIPINDLLKANPDIVPEKLQINQEVNLIVPKPLIVVVTMEKATYIEKIQYDVVYENSSLYYKDDYRTKVSGLYGELEIVANVFKENGIEVNREILTETRIKEPRTKVVYRGTKDPPPRIGTGTFDYPYDVSRGHVTSYFGMRYHPIYRDYRRHTGIDIGLPTGSYIYAADGGRVTFTGSKGGYGTTIMIDHGENITTLYAHLSKIYVKVGDMVFKGEKIGASGNTGVTTGPHLHFEVRKNGIPIDPKTKLSF